MEEWFLKYGIESDYFKEIEHEYQKQMFKPGNKTGLIRLFCWCAPDRCHAEIIKEYLENKYEK